MLFLHASATTLWGKLRRSAKGGSGSFHRTISSSRLSSTAWKVSGDYEKHPLSPPTHPHYHHHHHHPNPHSAYTRSHSRAPTDENAHVSPGDAVARVGALVRSARDRCVSSSLTLHRSMSSRQRCALKKPAPEICPPVSLVLRARWLAAFSNEEVRRSLGDSPTFSTVELLTGVGRHLHPGRGGRARVFTSKDYPTLSDEKQAAKSSSSVVSPWIKS